MYSRLSLEGNELGEEAGKAIGDALKTNTTLTTLKYDPLVPCAAPIDAAVASTISTLKQTFTAIPLTMV
jgi:hypothetical protein